MQAVVPPPELEKICRRLHRMHCIMNEQVNAVTKDKSCEENNSGLSHEKPEEEEESCRKNDR